MRNSIQPIRGISQNPQIVLKVELSGSVGRMLDWELKGCYFKSHCRRSHYVMSLSKTLYPLLSTGSTQEDSSRHD